MSVTSVSCAGTESASLSSTGERSYVVKYLVVTNSVNDQSLTVCRAAGIPSLSEWYSVGNDSDRAAFPSEYSPRLISAEGSRKAWEVLVTFSTAKSNAPQGDGTDGFGGYDYPWLEPVTATGSGVKTEELARVRYTNPDTGETGLLTNSAGAFMDDEYVERSSYMLSLAVKYQYANWSFSITAGFVDKLNNATFFGLPAGYLKMAAPRWGLLFTGESLPYWDVQYEFEGRFGGWNATPKIDEGYWYIDIADHSRVKRFADDMGLPISGKGRLNGLGDKLPSWADPVYHPSSGINKYRTANFALLGIPISVDQVVQNSFTRKQT